MSQTEELKRLKELVGQLKEENQQLVNRNMQLSDQLCMWYELRQRANWLKEEMLRTTSACMLKADMADDAELFAAIETRLEQDLSILTPDFDAVQLAEMLGVSQDRLTKLFRTTPSTSRPTTISTRSA